MDYWRKIWQCPYFKWDDKLILVCEGGRIVFQNERAARAFFDRCCASLPGWRSCPLAVERNAFYERGGDADEDEA